jgi:hypothetical protein
LAKQKTNLRYIYKIHSSRLSKSNWNLSLSIPEAIDNEEFVSLADSTTLRFINRDRNIEENANEIRRQIKILKKQETNIENRRNIKKLYVQLYNILFVKDYVCIIIDKNKHFDRMNNTKKFYINGIKFKRLLATNGGAKKSTVIYVNEKIYDDLHKRIENGRDDKKELVPAKLESYKSLTCSASIPVSNPKGILVVNDCETEFYSDVILLDDSKTKYPSMTYEENYPIKLVENDGYGLICPELSLKWAKEIDKTSDYTPSGLCLRNSFCKGMVFTFDYFDFATKIAKGKYIVKDVWGDYRDIRKVQLVLTASMLKLWDSYDNLEHYIKCCDENDYVFSVTKMTPKKLENERNLNYQFIQSYELSDEDIDKLIKPTIQEIHDVLGNDPIKSILFLRGMHLSENSYDNQETDFIKALMIDKEMIKDPFVKNKIHNSIKKRITEAKIGVLKVKANYSIISGDPFSLCQNIFGLSVTGLLKSGEFYSKYWNDKEVDKVVCYRAPMTCHNNIRILRFKNTSEMQYWYKYMNTVTIFNSWDTTTHALNGADKDSDQVLTTNDPILLKNTKELDAVLCIQKSAQKIIVNEKDLIEANKNGFGDTIGSTTNKITTMIDVASNFNKESEEYKELQYRVICGQNYQQNAIDKIKGCISKPMPKEWYDYHSAKNSEKSKLNLNILADKKPYFFIYNYPYLMRRYKRYISNVNKNCLMRFGLDVTELIAKENRNTNEEQFLKYYYIKRPIFNNKSVMNRICWKIEKEFDDFKSNNQEDKFDSSILKSPVKYSKKRFNKIKEIYEDYNLKLRQHAQNSSKNKLDKDEEKTKRIIFKDNFKIQAQEICNNEDELCNIVVDLCYKNNYSKQFAWDICGNVFIKNLLKKNNNIVYYPIADDNGSIEFGGEKFSMFTKDLTKETDCEEEYDINIE